MCCLRHVKRTCGSSSMRSRAFGCGQTSPEPLWGWTYLAATPNQNPDPEKTTSGKEKRWFTYMSNASDQKYVILSLRCHHTKPGKADLIQNSKLEQHLTGASLHGFHFRGPINRKKTQGDFPHRTVIQTITETKHMMEVVWQSPWNCLILAQFLISCPQDVSALVDHDAFSAA